MWAGRGWSTWRTPSSRARVRWLTSSIWWSSCGTGTTWAGTRSLATVVGEVWPEVACTAHRRLDRDTTAWAASRLTDAVEWLRDQGMKLGHCGMAAGGDL